MERALAHFFNYEGVEFVGPNGIPPGEANELEEMFYRSLAAHDSYWLGHPKFDCRNAAAALPHLRCPAIDFHYLLSFSSLRSAPASANHACSRPAAGRDPIALQPANDGRFELDRLENPDGRPEKIRRHCVWRRLCVVVDRPSSFGLLRRHAPHDESNLGCAARRNLGDGSQGGICRGNSPDCDDRAASCS